MINSPLNRAQNSSKGALPAPVLLSASSPVNPAHKLFRCGRAARAYGFASSPLPFDQTLGLKRELRCYNLTSSPRSIITSSNPLTEKS